MNSLNDFWIAEAILELAPDALIQVTGINESDVVWSNDEDFEKPAWEDVLALAQQKVNDYNQMEYARKRAIAYPNMEEFMEAYTEKEVLGDSTKWDSYVVKYNKVKSDFPKPNSEDTP
jgi:ABC-type Fe3+-citrate transport system substrate-binding protein